MAIGPNIIRLFYFSMTKIKNVALACQAQAQKDYFGLQASTAVAYDGGGVDAAGQANFAQGTGSSL